MLRITRQMLQEGAAARIAKPTTLFLHVNNINVVDAP
jgi:hypothetical protein